MQTKGQRYNATPWGRYANQRRNAKKRKIPFLMTFDEWWKLWQDSGRWDLYGRHKGQYCMARHEDAGAYEITNVRVCLVEENHTERSRTAPITGERNGMYGKSLNDYLTPEQRAERSARISKFWKGRKRSPEHSAKLAAALRGRSATPAQRANLLAATKVRRCVQRNGHYAWAYPRDPDYPIDS